MTSESQRTVFSCQRCDEEFEEKDQLTEHREEEHGIAPDKERGESKDAAAASSDASGSTGSITEENNESLSAAEPSEAAGPAGTDDDVRPETDNED
ncbi:hypothetical protein [Halococcus sediminicola]|uniref:hypothetical protein n=1 Tax=Halococcus sediminicola TaxID=1264579 RepID=UPI000678D2DA|nr:hypothetical protein [Halococcus sediminicola]